MKNKRLTYILIPLVILVWGLIFYKIFNHTGGDNKTNVSTALQKLAKNDHVKDTFNVKANYRDPFLRGSVRSVIRQSGSGEMTSNRQGFSKQKETKPEIRIPDLKYFGLIANSKNKQKIGLFRLNNKDLILKEADLYEEFKISRLYNDSVQIAYKKIKKTFKKNTNPS